MGMKLGLPCLGRNKDRKNRVMRKLCGPKRDKIKGELRRSHNEKCHDHTPGGGGGG